MKNPAMDNAIIVTVFNLSSDIHSDFDLSHFHPAAQSVSLVQVTE